MINCHKGQRGVCAFGLYPALGFAAVAPRHAKYDRPGRRNQPAQYEDVQKWYERVHRITTFVSARL